MPRSRPASNPMSFHKATNQYYVTRTRRRIYLGSDKGQAIKRFHEMGLGIQTSGNSSSEAEWRDLTVKDLANRFLAAQRANWRNPETTLKSYRDWLGRFLTDHPRLRAGDFTVEAFADWKLSLKRRGFSAESINHYPGAVRSVGGVPVEQPNPNLKTHVVSVSSSRCLEDRGAKMLWRNNSGGCARGRVCPAMASTVCGTVPQRPCRW